MKKKTLFKKRALPEDMSLQITSMADIFVIILVFLLKSYATGAVSVAPSPGLQLPQAVAPEADADALKVEVSEKSVLIEGEPAAALQAFQFTTGDIQGNNSSKALSSALEKQRQKQLLIAKTNTDVKVDSRILVIADQRVPYSTLKSVLASAALQGYTDFKLAVVKGD